ncbi:MAG: hypothetical protein K6C99_02245 [Lachnospiraceae bacterium]|nr:hypothetical protein [Lachnospiraceae bacterium]
MDNQTPHMRYNAAGQGVTLHCPGCAAALVFDPVSGKMHCESCGNLYSTNELGYENRFSVDDGEMMECNVYRCRSCGAELNVSDNTCSTFCAYCGQPTVVFDRVASMRKPQFIIPFSITKDQAVGLLRFKVNEGSFVPKEVKEFSIDRITGIYVPFWLFDMDYEDRQLLSGEVGSGKNSHKYHYYREGSTHFRNLTLDASRQLNDDSSKRLEPYMTEALLPFKADYLSGFYSDRYDVDKHELMGSAVRRAADLFDQEIVKDVSTGCRAHNVKILKKDPNTNVTDIKYALLPAWFLTFRYKDTPYTMLVNGQTGKVIGGLPYEKTPLTLLFLLIFVILAPLAAMLYNYIGFDDLRITGMAVGGAALLLGKALKNLKDIEISNKLSSASDIARYSKDR